LFHPIGSLNSLSGIVSQDRNFEDPYDLIHKYCNGIASDIMAPKAHTEVRLFSFEASFIRLPKNWKLISVHTESTGFTFY
jgi:hypothetical protein